MYNFFRVVERNVIGRVAPKRSLSAVLALVASSQLLACGAAMDPQSADGQSDEESIASASAALSTRPDASPFGCSGTQIAISPYYGDQYCGAFTGENGNMGCGDHSVYTWDRFTVYRVFDGAIDSGRIALTESHLGRYVSAANGGGGGLHADRRTVGTWEVFIPERLAGDQRFAFRTYKNYYFTAENGGSSAMNANRSRVGTWETFHVSCL